MCTISVCWSEWIELVSVLHDQANYSLEKLGFWFTQLNLVLGIAAPPSLGANKQPDFYPSAPSREWTQSWREGRGPLSCCCSMVWNSICGLHLMWLSQHCFLDFGLSFEPWPASFPESRSGTRMLMTQHSSLSPWVSLYISRSQTRLTTLHFSCSEKEILFNFLKGNYDVARRKLRGCLNLSLFPTQCHFLTGFTLGRARR